MIFEPKDNQIMFLLDGQTYSREEVKKMIQILNDLTETNDYEFPYRVPELISRASVIVKRSKK